MIPFLESIRYKIIYLHKIYNNNDKYLNHFYYFYLLAFDF